MTHGSKARLAYFLLGGAGVFLLGAATPWLKSFGTTVYVSASFAYLIVLWLLATFVARRVLAGKRQGTPSE